MNRNDDNLQLFHQRTIGELLGVPLDFLRHYRRLWLLYVALPLLPLSLLLAFIDSPQNDTEGVNVWAQLMGFDFDMGESLFSVEMLVVALSIAFVLWTVHTLLRFTRFSSEGVPPHTLIRSILRQSLLKLAVLFVLASLMLCLLNVSTGWAFLLIFLFLPIACFPSSWFLDDTHVGESMARMLTVGVRQWPQMVVILFVMGTMVFMLRGVVHVPALLIEQSVNVLTMADERPEGWLLFLQFLSTMLSWWAFFLGYSILVIALAYVYGDGVERVHNVSLTDKINQFENL